MKTVPLVVYENGKRVEVGTAVIDIDGGYLDVTAKLDENMNPIAERLVSAISLGPFSIQGDKNAEDRLL
jgi:hypothetical protein